MSGRCELHLQADYSLLHSFPSSHFLCIPRPPEPSSHLCLGMDGCHPLGVCVLTSLGKELRINLLEVLLVDDSAGTFLGGDSQTEQRYKPHFLSIHHPETPRRRKNHPALRNLRQSSGRQTSHSPPPPSTNKHELNPHAPNLPPQSPERQTRSWVPRAPSPSSGHTSARSVRSLRFSPCQVGYTLHSRS